MVSLWHPSRHSILCCKWKTLELLLLAMESGREASDMCPSAEPCCNVQVLVVPLLAGATGKADVKPLTYVSALMALAGVGLLVEKGGVIMPNPGDAWSFASAVFFGIQVGLILLLRSPSLAPAHAVQHVTVACSYAWGAWPGRSYQMLQMCCFSAHQSPVGISMDCLLRRTGRTLTSGALLCEDGVGDGCKVFRG